MPHGLMKINSLRSSVPFGSDLPFLRLISSSELADYLTKSSSLVGQEERIVSLKLQLSVSA